MLFMLLYIIRLFGLARPTCWVIDEMWVAGMMAKV